eukprot:8748468-Pyramimonas_sp.AAC.1
MVSRKLKTALHVTVFAACLSALALIQKSSQDAFNVHAIAQRYVSEPNACPAIASIAPFDPLQAPSYHGTRSPNPDMSGSGMAYERVCRQAGVLEFPFFAPGSWALSELSAHFVIPTHENGIGRPNAEIRIRELHFGNLIQGFGGFLS